MLTMTDIFKYLTTLTSVMDSMSPAEENAFVGDTYSQFPNVSVPRKSREHCLDAALNAITHKSAFSEASRYLALIANLVDLPHGNARLVSILPIVPKLVSNKHSQSIQKRSGILLSC